MLSLVLPGKLQLWKSLFRGVQPSRFHLFDLFLRALRQVIKICSPEGRRGCLSRLERPPHQEFAGSMESVSKAWRSRIPLLAPPPKPSLPRPNFSAIQAPGNCSRKGSAARAQRDI